MTLTSLLGPNWRTSLSGYIGTGAGLVFFLHQAPFSVAMPAWLVGTAAFVTAGGAVAFARNAKDKQVTGGLIAQPGIPVADPLAAARVAAVVLTPVVSQAVKPSPYKPGPPGATWTP